MISFKNGITFFVFRVVLPGQPFFVLYHSNPFIPNRNEGENAGYKLVRMLMEQPHIAGTDLQKISCPSLVIGGDHDVIKVEHTREIFNNIPKAYLWILPGSGHSTPIKFVDEFNKKIEEFFKKSYREFEIMERLF